MNDINRDICLEGENFNDFVTLKDLECFRCALICLIQTNRERSTVNKLFFIAMVKKLAERCCMENQNPSMLELQRSCQPTKTTIESLHAFDNIGFLRFVKNKLCFFQYKNKETFINMTKIIYIIPYFAESIDVSDFDLSIDFYDFEQNADIEEYFCRFPEYNRYMGYNLHCGPTFIYQYI